MSTVCMRAASTIASAAGIATKANGNEQFGEKIERGAFGAPFLLRDLCGAKFVA